MEQSPSALAAIGQPSPQDGSGAPCPGARLSLPAVCLEDALRRFEREAIVGVCATGRYRCSFFTWGSGPPLLFIHGLGDVARSYVPVISALTSSFRCIAYDLPSGRGDAGQLGRYTHQDLVRDLFALLDHLGLPQSYVFGSSFGSTIALAAMRAEPRRIPRAVLAGAFAQRSLAPAERLLARLARCLPGTARLLPFRKLIGKQALGPLAVKRPEFFDFFLHNTGVPRLTVMAQRACMIHQLDLRTLLPQIEQPVLLIRGAYDSVVGQICTDVLLQGLPHGAGVELHDGGHMAQYTHPEVLAEWIRRFLTPP